MTGKQQSPFYPKAKYHATEKPALVNNPEEDRLLGGDWYDHPNLTRDPSAPVTVLEDVGPTPVYPSIAEAVANAYIEQKKQRKPKLQNEKKVITPSEADIQAATGKFDATLGSK